MGWSGACAGRVKEQGAGPPRAGPPPPLLAVSRSFGGATRPREGWKDALALTVLLRGEKRPGEESSLTKGWDICSPQGPGLCVLPQTHMLRSQPPRPREVALFGHKTTADVTGQRVATGEEGGPRDPWGRLTCEDSRSAGEEAPGGQAGLGGCVYQLEAGRGEEQTSPKASGQRQPHQHLYPRAPDCPTEKESLLLC